MNVVEVKRNNQGTRKKKRKDSKRINTKKNKRKSKNKKLWDQFYAEYDKPDKKEEIKRVYLNQQRGLREHCDKCGSTVHLTEHKYLACSNNKCGALYTDILDTGAEWRYYGAEDSNSSDPTRCGMPINPLLEKSSYGCKVLCRGNSSYEMRKIRRYTDWQAMPYKEKAQYEEFQRIKTLSHNHGIPKIIIDEAMVQHKKLSELKTYRGSNRSGIIAASIYISCRIHKYPRTAKEIAVIFHLDIQSATKGCKNAVHLLNSIEKNTISNEKTHFCQTNPLDFIERYCSKLNMNDELTKVCEFVAVKLQENDLIPENTPHSVAAGIVYFVAQSCKLNISKNNVNKVSEISEVTINKCYKKLDKFKEQLIPGIILEKYS